MDLYEYLAARHGAKEVLEAVATEPTLENQLAELQSEFDAVASFTCRDSTHFVMALVAAEHLVHATALLTAPERQRRWVQLADSVDLSSKEFKELSTWWHAAREDRDGQSRE